MANKTVKGATKASAKANKTGNTSAKKATKKVAETATVEEIVTPEVIEATDTPVLDAPSDITIGESEVSEQETAPVEAKPLTCGTCGTEAVVGENGLVTNFSMLASGKYRNLCKPCQTAKSMEWTSRPEVAEMRKAQARARFFQNHGIMAIIPTAAGWVAGQAIMTYEQTLPDGTIQPSRNAEEIYAEQVAATKAANDERKQAAQAIIDAAKAANKLQREADKAKRDADRAEAARLKTEQKAADKEAKDKLRAENAQKALADREAANQVKAAERAENARLKAEQAKADAEQKAKNKAEAARVKAEQKAADIAAKKSAAATAAQQKALAALKGENR